MQTNTVKFIGGPRDGEVLINELGFNPDVIDGTAIHLFGDEAYVLIEQNFNTGIAKYEHMKLVHNPEDESVD